MSKFSSTVSLGALIAALSFGAAQADPTVRAYSAPTYAQPQFGPAAQPFYEPMEQSAPDQDAQIDPRLQRQIVSFQTREAPGTIIIDTPNTYLYYVLGGGQAIRYGIGVGRDGFTWSGVKQVARKAEWPDWHPPAEMIARQPYLPRFVAGGPGNPLGARAMYLGGTAYRIHGTNDPTTIGKDVSSGCIRLTNEDVEDLYARVQVGAKVIVLPQTHNTVARARAQQPPRQRIAQQMPVSSSYAPESRAQSTWTRISQTSLY
jgi:lipoprotein-anchoring transpeptidase ErfK/SrfK